MHHLNRGDLAARRRFADSLHIASREEALTVAAEAGVLDRVLDEVAGEARVVVSGPGRADMVGGAWWLFFPPESRSLLCC